ncbi:MAG TPA: hypothetical protein VJB12_03860 [Candidatus Nanoarchaeia archaeon]|nr:hypothetical protein [Candidatus Nanoarchaeia archaeon]
MAKEQAQHAKIRCRTIIEVLGKPKEHVDKTIREYVQKIKVDTDFVILSEDFSECDEQKDGFFSVFVELELLSKGLIPLIGFCFNYMPSSIEIEKPEELSLPSHMINTLFNDLQARLHKVDMVVKQQANENQFLRGNLKNSLRNLIVVSLALKPFTLEKLSKATGVEKAQLTSFLDDLIKEGKVRKNGEAYSLNK